MDRMRTRFLALSSSLVAAALLLLQFLLLPQFLLAQDVGEATKTEERPREASSFDYLSLRRYMVGLCKVIDEDARGDSFYQIILHLNQRTPLCPGCKPFFAQFDGACKKKKQLFKIKKQKKEGEESPSPSPTPVRVFKQREPNAAAIDLISRIAVALYENDSQRDENSLVVKKMVRAIAELGDGNSQGDKEYFDILVSYLNAPFEEYLEARSRSEQAKPSTKRTSPEDLNSLFPQ